MSLYDLSIAFVPSYSPWLTLLDNLGLSYCGVGVRFISILCSAKAWNHVSEPDLCFFFCTKTHTHIHTYTKAWLLPFFPEVKSFLLKEEEGILSPSLAEVGRVQAEKANFLC